jgi:hypothetical protein
MRIALLATCLAIVSCVGCEKRIHEAGGDVRGKPLVATDHPAARPQG